MAPPHVTIRLADAADYEAVASLNAEVQQLHADGLPHLFLCLIQRSRNLPRVDLVPALDLGLETRHV
jgi:hypothetical protein